MWVGNEATAWYKENMRNKAHEVCQLYITVSHDRRYQASVAMRNLAHVHHIHPHVSHTWILFFTPWETKLMAYERPSSYVNTDYTHIPNAPNWFKNHAVARCPPNLHPNNYVKTKEQQRLIMAGQCIWIPYSNILSVYGHTSLVIKVPDRILEYIF